MKYISTIKKISFLLLLTVFAATTQLHAQVQIGNEDSQMDYSNPHTYTIGGITATGTQYIDNSILISMTGLHVGNEISVPGDEISSVIRKLWEHGMFEDISINATNIIGDKIFLEIAVKERPRVSKFSFSGIKKSEADEIRGQINISRGDVATEHLFVKTKRIIENYYADKGFLNAEIDITEIPDTTRANYVDLKIDIDKGSKVKIGKINVIGNENLSDAQILAAMKDTKQRGVFNPLDPLGPLVINTITDVFYNPKRAMEGVEYYFYDNYRPRIFKSSKYNESNFRDDKQKIIDKYNSKGYRDAIIVNDSVYKIDENNIGIDLVVDEGDRYYYRNITWTGNTKYTTDYLNQVLGIRKGDVYNKELLNTNLTYNENSIDVGSLYMDDGYLFFQANPVEVLVENDSIDLEIRMHEGEQARINNVTLKGNTKTNDHVVIRELYSRPGQLFSRSDITRSVRELATLGFFNQETISPDVKPNFTDGTVDIEYQVEEASADQVELSAGWGYGMLMLSLGLSFNNFSFGKMFKKDAWKPVPSGDGQKLSLRLTTYGIRYINYGLSFTEPWLGGKKPTSLTVSIYQSFYSNGEKLRIKDETTGIKEKNEKFGWFRITGGTVGIGQRLTWPDDYFTLYQSISYMRYDLKNYSSVFSFGDGNGHYNLLSYNIVLGRSSVSQPIYPRNGSEFQLSLELTPPYSLFAKKDYSSMTENEKYKWIEMHKWKFKAVWYTELYDKLVLMTRVRFGFLGSYNKEIGITPFHRFFLGGDGLGTYSLDSREMIGMRGYKNDALTPSSEGGNIFAKYTLELRYPLSLNPQATIYALGFVEAGNCWMGVKGFNPFKLKRSAGVGVRVYLPMFGLLGLDWGYGFDEVNMPGVTGANKSQFHFSIGGSID